MSDVVSRLMDVESEARRIIEEARQDAAGRVEEARTEARQLVATACDEARGEAEAVLQQAAQEAETRRRQALEQAAQEAPRPDGMDTSRLEQAADVVLGVVAPARRTAP